MSPPRFGSIGGLVQPVPTTDPASLRALLNGEHGLPKRLRGHTGLDSFLQAVSVLCAMHESMRGDAPSLTAKQLRVALNDLAAAAHRMQRGLGPVRHHSATPEVFGALEPVYWMLARRALDSSRDLDPAEPPISRRLPLNLQELLSLIDDGLTALCVTCHHAAGQITPSSAVANDRGRELARAVAAAHNEAFGELPPEGGWFGRGFMPELGKRIGWKEGIGHAVVSQAIEGLRSELAPPPG
jgi:hypothetical protein